MDEVNANRIAVVQIARWALVVPAGVAGWFIALAAGLGLHGVADGLCPAEHVVSGACMAAWAPLATDVIVALCAALAAVLIVVLPVAAAPSHRPAVAWAAFTCGLVAAAHAVVVAGAWVPFGSAVLAGLATLTVLLRHRRVRAA